MLKIGIVGASGLRASIFREGVEATKRAAVTAICDVNAEALEKTAAGWGTPVELYTEYDKMIDRAGLDAVIVSTPVEFHAAQSVKALNKNIHVYCEVPAAVTLDECKTIVSAEKASRGTFVLGANGGYNKILMTVANMVQDGLFGEIYYMQGEYLHDLKEFFKFSKWRKKILAGINGITYGSHSITPMQIWMRGDRISRLMCVGTGHHYTDSDTNSPYIQEDGVLMICKTEQGRSVDIRGDMLPTRPYGCNFRLQGTKGAYEHLRTLTGDNVDRFWANRPAEESGMDAETWMDIRKYLEDYIPPVWHKVPQAVIEANAFGGGGADWVIMKNYVDYLYGDDDFFVGGIHEAMNMTLPGIISKDSINNGSIWLDVPDSRRW